MSNFSERVEQLSPLQRAVFALKEMRAQLDAIEQARIEPIAIVGLGCRFPGGARDADSFWEFLKNGVDAITEVPPTRWDLEKCYDPQPGTPGKMYTRWGGFLEDLDQFDALFFGISPREAVGMDPQQRLLLEVTWEALENAGQAPNHLRGQPVGVFVGVAPNEYSQQCQDPTQIDSHILTGNAISVAAGRLAYILGLQGPALALDTACSSSLMAVHLACQSLRQGECRMALAGGVNVLLSPASTIALCEMHALSPDGRCKTFSASADGYVRSDGCGMVVLKRLSDALADRDHIWAIIRGSAVNHDGRSAGLTVPNGPSQEAVIRQALKAARIDPAEVHYVEAHGTGTPLGDPIEVRALMNVFGQRPGENPLLIGSVKTNLGHLEAAAGIAGLIKVVLSLDQGEIPRHLHCYEPSPHIAWQELPVRVTTQSIPWRRGSGRRIAGVSSFGFSGTNTHALIEEAPATPEPPSTQTRAYHLLTLSGRSAEALRELAHGFQHHLTLNSTLPLTDLCYTANTGRAHQEHRAALVVASRDQTIEHLSALAAGENRSGLLSGEVEGATRPKVAFLFTGQGSQYVGMGRQLYETQATFRDSLDHCAEILQSHLKRPLLEVLYPEGEDGSFLDQTLYTQPALFALEYALAQLWMSWGIQPGAVLGHSVGEYVAACVAGVLTLEDSLKLIATRARLMQELPAGGAMAAVFTNPQKLRPFLDSVGKEVALGALNGPENTVIAGAVEKVDRLLQALAVDGIKGQRLAVSHAFHSPLIAPMLDDYERFATTLPHVKPRLRMVSNVTGNFIEEITPAYWRRHTREAVRFADGMHTLHQQGYTAFLEIGPQPILTGMGQRSLPEGVAGWLPSLRRGRDDWQQLLTSVGQLHVLGAAIDWAAFHKDDECRKIPLPTYPFQRQRYWMESETVTQKPFVRNSRTGSQPVTFPGSRLSSPLKQVVFEVPFSEKGLPFLSDHLVHDRIVIAGACHLSLVLAGVREIRSVGVSLLKEVVFPQALVLSEREVCRVQLLFEPGVEGETSFQVFSTQASQQETSERWTVHARGELREGVLTRSQGRVSLVELQARCRTDISVSEFYQRLAEHGVNLGSRFRWIQELKKGQGEALCRMRHPTIDESHIAPMHPGLLDSCIQLVVAALPWEDMQTGPYIPVELKALRVEGDLTFPLWGHARLHPWEGSQREEFVGDVQLFEESGGVVAEFKELRFRRAPRGAFLSTTEDKQDGLLYRIRWQQREHTSNKLLVTGNWLIFADQLGVGEELAAQLRERGCRCALVHPGTAIELSSIEKCSIRANCPDDFHRLFGEIERTGTPLAGVIYLWNLEQNRHDPLTSDELQQGQTEVCGGMLLLIQALAGRTDKAPRVWLVTRGSQPAGDGLVAVGGSTLWGLGGVVALEHPELQCVRIDLDPARPKDEINRVLEELRAEGSEDQVAFRNGMRWVARLVPEQGDLDVPQGQPCQLEVTTPGMLEVLALRPLVSRTVGEHEVEIKVHSTGLNFRDVLNALSLYPGEAGPLGLECTGTIVAVGKGVEHLHVGDKVLAMASGSFRTEVVTDAHLVAPIPGLLTLEEAATIPVVFLTAWYGLHHLAKLVQGERILIHAAAGGVGLATIQIAQLVGAEVYATAGSSEKRAYLESLGVKHVFNSRSLDFAEEVQRSTNGEGVHVVLNSLAGEFIPKSVSVLAPGGRFVEIGKTDIWSVEKVSSMRADVSYFVIALDQLGRDNPVFVGSLLRELLPLFAEGSLKPLRRQVFPLSKVRDAFRWMASARHVGKIVVSLEARTSELIHMDATYLITGGFGALGLRVARWLVEDGARNLVLVGRRGPRSDAQKTVRELEEAGARVVAAQVDIAEEDAVGKLFAELQDSLPPLRGVFHAAGVLEDGVLVEQTWDRFSSVLAPKVWGTWNLHLHTQSLQLDHFVLFSSAASLLGSPGQGNYAAANAFLDALAHYRQALGLPAISINWGPWEEEGMAADLGEHERRRWHVRGITMITPNRGIEILGDLLRRAPIQVGVLSIDWHRFLNSVNAGRIPALFSELSTRVASQPGRTERPDLLKIVLDTPPNLRRAVLVEFLREQTLKVLGLDASHPLGNQQPLSELGLDSLLAVELRNTVSAAVGSTLSATLLFNYPSIEALADYLLQELRITPTSAELIEEEQGDESGGVELEIEQLSELELDELLADFADKHLTTPDHTES